MAMNIDGARQAFAAGFNTVKQSLTEFGQKVAEFFGRKVEVQDPAEPRASPTLARNAGPTAQPLSARQGQVGVALAPRASATASNQAGASGPRNLEALLSNAREGVDVAGIAEYPGLIQERRSACIDLYWSLEKELDRGGLTPDQAQEVRAAMSSIMEFVPKEKWSMLDGTGRNPHSPQDYSPAQSRPAAMANPSNLGYMARFENFVRGAVGGGAGPQAAAAPLSLDTLLSNAREGVDVAGIAEYPGLIKERQSACIDLYRGLEKQLERGVTGHQASEVVTAMNAIKEFVPMETWITLDATGNPPHSRA